MGREKVSIAGPDMRLRSRTRTASQDHLIAHELAVVLPNSTRCRREARISDIGARGPLPNVAEHLRQSLARPCRLRMKHPRLHEVAFEAAGARRNLPFELGRKPGS